MPYKQYDCASLVDLKNSLVLHYGAGIEVFASTTSILIFKIPSLSSKVIKLEAKAFTYAVFFTFAIGDAFTEGSTISNPIYLSSVPIDEDQKAGNYPAAIGYSLFVSENGIIMLQRSTYTHHHGALMAKLNDNKTVAMGLTSVPGGAATISSLKSYCIDTGDTISMYLQGSGIKYDGQVAIKNIPLQSGPYTNPFQYFFGTDGNPILKFKDIYCAELVGEGAISIVPGYYLLPKLDKGHNGANHGALAIALPMSL